MEEGKLKYSDLIQDDGALENLLKQLSDVQSQYSELADSIKASANAMASALRPVSGAVATGRQSIENATDSAEQLLNVMTSVKATMSDTGQAVAALKSEMDKNSTVTAKAYKAIEQSGKAYAALNAELSEYIGLYKDLSDQDKSSQFGKDLLDEIKQLAAQTNKLNSSLRALTGTTKEYKSNTEKIAETTKKIEKAQKGENRELKGKNEQLKAANRMERLQAQLSNTTEGSYKRMAVQYAINKEKLAGMKLDMDNLTESQKKLIAETYQLYQQMKKFQEMTGVHSLSVGQYAKVWDGLGFSVAQVVRELPSLAYGATTFFSAISNNIPIVVDEINKIRKANEAARVTGDKTTSVIGAIGKSLLSFNTVLVVSLTLLTVFGEKIINAFNTLVRFKKGAISAKEALKAINTELESAGSDFGSNVVKYTKLQKAYEALRTEGEKTEWIEQYKSDVEQLGFAVIDVVDADRLFIDETPNVIKAFKLRAKAAAAESLAMKAYESALQKESKLAERAEKGPTIWNYLMNPFDKYGMKGYGIEMMFLSKQWQNATADAEVYQSIMFDLEKQAADLIKSAGLKSSGGTDGDKGRDVTDRVYRARNEAIKKFEESQTALIREEYDRRKKELMDKNAAEIASLEETNRKSWEILQDKSDDYKDLTEEERQAIVATIEANNATILNMEEQLTYDLQQLAIDREIGGLKVQEDANKLQLQAIKEGSEEELELRKKSIENQKQMELLENSKLEKSVQQQEADIIAKYNKMLEDLANERNIALKEAAIRGIELQLQAAKEGSEEEYNLQLKLLGEQEALEKEKNAMLDKSLRVDEKLIEDSYARRKNLLKGQYQLGTFKQGQATKRAEKVVGPSGNKWSKRVSEYDLGIFDLEQEIALLNYQIKQAEDGLLEWDSEKIKEAKANVDKLNEDLADMKSFLNLIAKEGIGGGILMALGFDEDSISAMQDAGNIIIEQLQAIAEAEVEAAEKAVEAAQERADAARSAYEAEIEARNNGYANNVATAKKELELEKKNQMQKQKELEKAQRNQARIDSAMQASSLITATANLLASYSSLGPLGSILSIAAITAMWGTFIAAKVKAANVTSQKYGEGGLEILEGGSHASGNDIDMGMTNSKGRAMRAEGGEAVAIINRRNTRKYRKALPDIIDSLNKGYFEDKYLNSLNTGGISLSAEYGGGADLTRLESSVDDIKRQGETRYYSHDGYLIVQHRNVKRIIKN